MNAAVPQGKLNEWMNKWTTQLKKLLVSLQPLIIRTHYRNFTCFTVSQTFLLSIPQFSSATLGGIND